MKAEEILGTIDHIRGMVQELTQTDGTVGMIDTKLPIALELCEQLLQDALDRMNNGKNQDF
jgi:hypothetical protein